MSALCGQPLYSMGMDEYLLCGWTRESVGLLRCQITSVSLYVLC